MTPNDAENPHNEAAMDKSAGQDLQSLFAEGIACIATQKNDNLFQDLETRTLTTREQDIISQRVALQRRLFEEYEKREMVRKIQELREVCPQISEAAAARALELCNGSEDEAAAELVGNPAFRTTVPSTGDVSDPEGNRGALQDGSAAGEDAADSDATVSDGEGEATAVPATDGSTALDAGNITPMPQAPAHDAGASGNLVDEGADGALRYRLAVESHGKLRAARDSELKAARHGSPERGWHNAGYIFPLGFVSRTLFRSSVALDQLCVHDCYVQGEGGEHWPGPTFRVVARDRPDEPLVAKSCTGCWTGVLKRINAEIEARRAAGEDLPPPPKTAIAGPEYFGLNQTNIQEAVEALDPHHLCVEYWAGKEQRCRAAAGLPAQPGPPPARAGRAAGPRPAQHGRRRAGREDPDGTADDEAEEEAGYASKWSGINRSERYRKRREEAGDDVTALDEDNPLPDLLDPITLEPVVRPAISPYGHVMGMATWKAVLSESKSCPFTKQPLTWESCKVLTKHNIHLHADRIIR
ncbi:Transforming growth factor beta regulator 1 [Auxenochlorella protothecoides]|uniref:Transforming growth factor beta regulator 1 n=2 Tax=Auxenochlorella protothecoides TaxID=3075 RepID=A0A087SJM8_AUXPR|nr:Transforming growth factor beta regulator 1 [Auxenochlorella protothecoides]KFM25932.1 Transforming growth factor beta regulator 1 [Auxenochlorella protothecoides]